MIRSRKITIYRITKPKEKNINEELQWFFDSLGLLGNRDRNKSCFRMVITLLKDLRQGEGMTSDEIADKVQLSRGTVVHHLHNLMDSGVVVLHRNKYMLRVENLRNLVDELSEDLYKTMQELKEVAEEIDKRMEL